MQKFTFLIIMSVMLHLAPLQAQETKLTEKDLTALKEMMTGFFSTKSQWQADTNYFYIRLCMQPLWPDSESGYWLYVEQASFGTPNRPYRQRIYHLYLHPHENAIVSKVYEIADQDYYVSACLNPELLDALTPERLVERPGCELLLARTGPNLFTGATRQGACMSGWRGASWVSSDVEVSPKGLLTWDRGWDASGNQVWGPEEGGYRFDRVVEEEEEEEE